MAWLLPKFSMNLVGSRDCGVGIGKFNCLIQLDLIELKYKLL
jgi:hypothetical protein